MKQEWKTPLRIGAVLFGLYLAIHYWGNLSALAALALGAGFPLMLGAVITPSTFSCACMRAGTFRTPKARPFSRAAGRCACCWPMPVSSPWWPSLSG